ncbi:hypothetical protein Pyrde_1209 [Pyrodictium delaneyi]|uniref:Uncharacterized protein n=1 Tax=Pyrodictium delaneyi TaxID=1273541 RepID=A0A0N7JD56_9CREN|nr:hypothetical protein [Pyrodictium delaneyi]ALL01257.1 hypothetical protein Pyrde_1209 [Pyrodictium delaneyi]OWJ55669.1 hypothetical protein Pdsh_02495 [Pyrodictium delaneyi]
MRNPIYSIALLGIVLASVAGAFAMWSETLMINAEVNTGEVDVAFTDWMCSDTGPDPQIPNSQFHNEEGKDVASCNVDVEILDEEGDVIKLLVTVDNAYPGYNVQVYMNISNIGTIPVKLYSSSIDGVNTTALAVGLLTPQDTQLHPGDTHTYTLDIAVLQDAAENGSYTFEVTLVFAQWNEVP